MAFLPKFFPAPRRLRESFYPSLAGSFPHSTWSLRSPGAAGCRCGRPRGASFNVS